MQKENTNDYKIITSESLTDTIISTWNSLDRVTMARHMNMYLAIILDSNNKPIRDLDFLHSLEEKNEISAAKGNNQKIVKIISNDGHNDYDIFMTDAPYSYLKRILLLQYMLDADFPIYIDWLEDDGYTYALLGTSCDEDDEDPDALTYDSPCDILFRATEFIED